MEEGNITNVSDCTVGPGFCERVAMQENGSWKTDVASFEAAKACFEKNGVVHIEDTLPSKLVFDALNKANDSLEFLEGEVAKQRSGLSQDEHHRAVRIHRCDFRELVKRDGGRLDMRYKMAEPPFSSSLLSYNPIWFPLVKELLGGGDVTLLYMGVMVARSSTVDHQKWHGDGGHLFTHEHSPPHCINVFVPLVDLEPRNGPTHFCPGTHRLGHFDDDGCRWSVEGIFTFNVIMLSSTLATSFIHIPGRCVLRKVQPSYLTTGYYCN
jgi:ectoine hydroxylase-related dioxygenase (phytanoyl-CoA dioxygenase family)